MFPQETLKKRPSGLLKRQARSLFPLEIRKENALNTFPWPCFFQKSSPAPEVTTKFTFFQMSWSENTLVTNFMSPISENVSDVSTFFRPTRHLSSSVLQTLPVPKMRNNGTLDHALSANFQTFIIRGRLAIEQCSSKEMLAIFNG